MQPSFLIQISATPTSAYHLTIGAKVEADSILLLVDKRHHLCFEGLEIHEVIRRPGSLVWILFRPRPFSHRLSLIRIRIFHHHLL